MSMKSGVFFPFKLLMTFFFQEIISFSVAVQRDTHDTNKTTPIIVK